jgi:hypothetical protein
MISSHSRCATSCVETIPKEGVRTHLTYARSDLCDFTSRYRRPFVPVVAWQLWRLALISYSGQTSTNRLNVFQLQFLRAGCRRICQLNWMTFTLRLAKSMLGLANLVW